MAQSGLVELEERAVQVTPAGWFLVRAIAMVFDRHLRAATERGRLASANCVSHLQPSIHAATSTRCCGFARRLPLAKVPVGAREVAGISPRLLLKIVLMLRLGFPEVSGGLNLSDDPVRPQA